MAWDVGYVEIADTACAIDDPVTGETEPGSGAPTGELPILKTNDEHLKDGEVGVLGAESLAGKFHASTGHGHTGIAGDGPQIDVGVVSGEVFSAGHLAGSFAVGKCADRAIHNENIPANAIGWQEMPAPQTITGISVKEGQEWHCTWDGGSGAGHASPAAKRRVPWCLVITTMGGSPAANRRVKHRSYITSRGYFHLSLQHYPPSAHEPVTTGFEGTLYWR